MGLDLLSIRLRGHAGAQRRASLGSPRTTVLRSSDGGDGRWVARIGTGYGGGSAAAVVVVLVPGVGTTGSDRDELRRDATRVWEDLAIEAERSGVDEHDVAVVSWLGYDPPNSVLAGVARGPARAGGRQLAADVAALRAEGVRRMIVVGHSYGGLVVTRAAAHGLAADELVLLGAPGLGVAHMDALHLAPGEDLWAAASNADPIAAIASLGRVHGPDPVALARRLPTSLAGHGAYLEDPAFLAALATLALHDPDPPGTVARTAR